MYGAHSTGSDPARGQDEIKPNTRRPNNNLAGINGKGGVPFLWTEKRTADLRGRWSAGESSSVIADALGTTRNAIIGKVHRLGLSQRTVKNDARDKKLATARKSDRGTSNAGAQVQAINRRPRQTPEAEATDPVARGTTTFEELRMFSEVDPNQCRFIEGDTALPLYCGSSITRPGKPYCALHHKVAHGRRINITEADRARRRAHATKVWFGASAKLVGNPAEVT